MKNTVGIFIIAASVLGFIMSLVIQDAASYVKKVKKHREVAIFIIAAGVLSFIMSIVFQDAASYFVIAGIIMVLVGCFIVFPAMF